MAIFIVKLLDYCYSNIIISLKSGPHWGYVYGQIIATDNGQSKLVISDKTVSIDSFYGVG